VVERGPNLVGVLAEVLPAQHLVRIQTGAAKPCRSTGVAARLDREARVDP
jgi:hypothetical protein